MSRPGCERAKAGVVPGLLLTGAIALCAMGAGAAPLLEKSGIGALTLAIVGGMAVGNSCYARMEAPHAPGVAIARNQLLRLGVVLYGARITFAQIADVGIAGFIIDALVLLCTFLLAVGLGTRVLGLDRDTSILIGAGSSICGAAAVLATEPVLRARADKVAVAVATVVCFGTVALFVYPLLFRLNQHWHWIVSDRAFGLYTGATVHEVAQVVAAARPMGAEASAVAVISKMIRIMLLAPFLLVLSAWRARHDGAGRGRLTVPWFAFGFIAVAGLHSWLPVPQAVQRAVNTVDTALLAMAMAALGLGTRFALIRRAGVRPLLLAAILFLFLLVGGWFIQQSVFVALDIESQWL